MRFFSLVVFLLFSVAIDASHDIPAVDELVSSVMHSLAAYTELATPTGTSAPMVAAATAAANSTRHGPASVDAVADASYWLASIAHQGVAAFNPNPSGYKVFRNVKDYGAKGTFLPLYC